MFGFSVDVVENSSRLVVTTPTSVAALLLGAVFAIWPLAIALRTKPLPRRKVAIWTAITFIAYGFFLTSSKVTLDRATQLATVRKFFFYHWESKSFPLSRIDKAYLRAGATTSRIVLQYADGSDESLSYSDQIFGKGRAVQAINRFLSER